MLYKTFRGIFLIPFRCAFIFLWQLFKISVVLLLVFGIAQGIFYINGGEGALSAAMTTHYEHSTGQSKNREPENLQPYPSTTVPPPTPTSDNTTTDKPEVNVESSL